MNQLLRIIATTTLLIIISAIVLIGIMILHNRQAKEDDLVIKTAELQRVLSQKIVKESYFLALHPDAKNNNLDSHIEEFEKSLNSLTFGNEEKMIYFPPNDQLLDRLENAQKLWLPIKQNISEVVGHKSDIVVQSEQFLQSTPKLQQITLEVAQMMERRRMPQRMIIEAENQIGLINSIVLLASSYLASGDQTSYEEFQKAVESYSSTLSNFANTETIVYASILALLADNQLLWDGYQESIYKAVLGQKALLDELELLQKENKNLFELLGAIVDGYSDHAHHIRAIYQWIQYISALILLISVIYTSYIVWETRSIVKRDEICITKDELISSLEPNQADQA